MSLMEFDSFQDNVIKNRKNLTATQKNQNQTKCLKTCVFVYVLFM